MKNPLLLLLTAALLVQTSPTFGGEETAPAWTRKMRALGKSLQELLVDLHSDRRFNDPANFKRIEKNAGEIAALAHGLKTKKEGASPDRDPSIALIAELFAKQAKVAQKALTTGHRAYGRDILKSMTGYCMACHTRNASGPGYAGTPSDAALSSLKGFEKADYLASVRQFDSALDEYERGLAEAASRAALGFDWEQGIRSSLAIAVRVKKDPDRALSIVSRVLGAKKAPYFLKEQAAEWKKTLEQWKSEAPRTAQTEEGLRAEAVRLISEAKTLQKYPADRSADILYLRASAVVHELLSVSPPGKHAVEAFYLAGLCYEVLNDLNLWDLHEFYYLACIRQAPHTPQARQCYRHYEESVYAGFTGSGGTFLPAEVRQELDQLDLISSPLQTVEKEVP